MTFRDQNWIDLARASGYTSANLAGGAGVSERTLRRHFIHSFRRPPQEWIDELRLWDAARLVCGGHQIKEIAWLLKFKSVPHFCRRFKQYHGCTPSEFKKQIQKRSEGNVFFKDDNVTPWVCAEASLVTILKVRPAAMRSQF